MAKRKGSTRPDQTEATIRARWEFTMEYCYKKGWDHNDLTTKQVIHIRKLSEWQNPLNLVNKKQGFHGEKQLYPAPVM